MSRLVAATAALLALVWMATASSRAHEAALLASPTAQACQAPNLLPSTPPSPAVAPTTTAATPAATPADAAVLARIRAAEENLVACINAGEYLKLTALMTPHYRQAIFRISDPEALAARLEAEGPFNEAIVSVDNARTYADGRVSAEVVWLRQGTLVRTLDYFLETGGWLFIDDLVRLPLDGGATPAT